MLVNENELKNILVETIYRILNELDWKTYNSAANKDKDTNRSQKFADARNSSFNRDYGYNDDKTSIEMNNGVVNKKAPHISIRLDNDKDIERFNNHGDSDLYHHSKQNKDGYNNTSGYAELPTSSDKKVARKMAKAHDEFSTFNNGNYKYNKGEGYKNIADTAMERPDGTPNTKSHKAKDWHNFLKQN